MQESPLPAAAEAFLRWGDALGFGGWVGMAAVAVAATVAVIGSELSFAAARRRRASLPPEMDVLIETTMRDGTERRRLARMDVETLPELEDRLRADAAVVAASVFRCIHRHRKSFADPISVAACEGSAEIDATAGMSMGSSSPDDLRRAGWTLAMHRDVALDGAKRVVWILERDGRSVSGEAATDVQALDAARRAAAGTPSGMAAAVAESEASR